MTVYVERLAWGALPPNGRLRTPSESWCPSVPPNPVGSCGILWSCVACMRAFPCVCVRACVHAFVRACVRACARKCMCACISACVRACSDGQAGRRAGEQIVNCQLPKLPNNKVSCENLKLKSDARCNARHCFWFKGSILAKSPRRQDKEPSCMTLLSAHTEVRLS